MTSPARRFALLASVASALLGLGAVGAGSGAAALTPNVATAVRPAVGGSTNDVYGYSDFYGVPHLGAETVSGTGCGGDGSIGPVIPDGYWRGYVRAFGPTSLEFDLVCVYGDDVDPNLITRWRAEHPGQPDPWVGDGFLINVDERTRAVSLAAPFFSHGTFPGADGSCPFGQPGVPFDAGHDAWIRIVGGQAQWAVSSCAGPAETTAFPYDDFYAVPQLGTESVRGTGCGGDGSIGPVIPDGLWYGNISSFAPTSLEFDLACIYVGAAAAQLYAENYDPNSTEPTLSPDIGYLVNNNPRTRTVSLAPTYGTAYANWASNGDPNWPTGNGPSGCVPPLDASANPYGGPIALPAGAWIAISGGQAQWTLVECPYG
ncbi:hypothetical protein BH24ACT5_BH24ACT5_26550 [soil metagenome]